MSKKRQKAQINSITKEATLTAFLLFPQSRPMVLWGILCGQDEGWGKRMDMDMVYE